MRRATHRRPSAFIGGSYLRVPFVLFVVTAVLSGCATDQVGTSYPVDQMLDPVTEEVPRVILPD